MITFSRTHVVPVKRWIYLECLDLSCNSPAWWREASKSGTEKLYQPEPRPVVYVVPIASILGLLPLISAGDHGGTRIRVFLL